LQNADRQHREDVTQIYKEYLTNSSQEIHKPMNMNYLRNDLDLMHEDVHLVTVDGTHYLNCG